MTRKELIYKICDETYHMLKIIESCKTEEQIDNANNLACSLVDKWFNLKANFSFSYGADIAHYINSSAHDMTICVEKAKKKIEKNMH